jgi:hypothetical protein
MSSRPRLSNLIWFIVAAGACSSSDTILALTINSSADIGAVETLHVVVTPASGTAFTRDFKPTLSDGSLKSSFLERIKLPSGLQGPATVTVEARDAALTTKAAGRTQTTIVEDGAVAASITLMPGALPPPPGDGGTDAADAGAGSDADAGSDTSAGSDTGAGDSPATDGSDGGDGGD